MSALERFDIRTLAAVGTLDFSSALPVHGLDTAFRFQANADGNFELKVLASDMDASVAGNFVDITSLISGGATITANGFYRTDRLYGSVRLNVTSLQSTKHLALSGSWM